ncbi:MAG: hypothetical protein ACXAC6_11680 [Candidatus Hodarchaeales archaeon]
MSAIPPSIRKILNSGRGEVKQLEHEYHIWLVLFGLASLSCILLLGTSISLFSLDSNNSYILIRLMVGVAAIINIFITYIILQETLNKRRYLLEIQRLMKNGLSFLDSIGRGLKGLFGK